MAITSSAVCNTFKNELLGNDIHNFDQTSGTGYAAGGKKLAIGSQTHKLASDTAIVDWANLSWQTATITARGALIYNDSQADKAVAVLDFGGDKTATAGTFTIQFPNFTDTLAILRIA